MKKKVLLELTCKRNFQEHIRTKCSKAFWNFLKEHANKVGNIDMDDWFQHFAPFFLKTSIDHSIEDFEEYNISIEELDKKFTLQN